MYAIDGTSLQIPDTKENVEYFGCKKNQYNTQTALASASAMYDVLNDVVLDAIIDSYPANEKHQARRHLPVNINAILLMNMMSPAPSLINGLFKQITQTHLKRKIIELLKNRNLLNSINKINGSKWRMTKQATLIFGRK